MVVSKRVKRSGGVFFCLLSNEKRGRCLVGKLRGLLGGLKREGWKNKGREATRAEQLVRTVYLSAPLLRRRIRIVQL